MLTHGGGDLGLAQKRIGEERFLVGTFVARLSDMFHHEIRHGGEIVRRHVAEVIILGLLAKHRQVRQVHANARALQAGGRERRFRNLLQEKLNQFQG